MPKLKKSSYPHLTAVSFRDLIEILFGVLLGLMIFLGASELWNIGAVLNDFMVILIVAINITVLYFLTRLIAGKIRKSTIFLESVRHPLERSAIVYVIGFFISLSTVFWLKETGVLASFVQLSTAGFFPPYIKIASIANLFATMFAITIDLTVAD